MGKRMVNNITKAKYIIKLTTPISNGGIKRLFHLFVINAVMIAANII